MDCTMRSTSSNLSNSSSENLVDCCDAGLKCSNSGDVTLSLDQQGPTSACGMDGSSIGLSTNPRGQIISNLNIKLMRLGYKWSPLTACHPYMWCPHQDGPAVVKSALKLWTWRFHVLASICYWIFVTMRCIHVNRDPSYGVSTRVYMQFMAIMYGFNVMHHMNNVLFKHKFSAFTKRYVRFQRWCEESLGEQRYPLSKRIEFFLAQIHFSFKGAAVAIACIPLVRPHSPELLSSIIQDPKSIAWSTRLLFVLIQGYIMFVYEETCTIWSCGTFGFFFPSLDLIQLLRRQLETPTKRNKRDWERMFHLYRCLMLQMQEFNTVYVLLVSECTVILSCFGVFGTYGAIRLGGVIAYLMGGIGIIGTGFLMLYLATMAEFNSRSRKALVSMRRAVAAKQDCVDKRWLRTSVRALREGRARVGSLYFVDKQLVLTTVAIIVDRTIDLLISC